MNLAAVLAARRGLGRAGFVPFVSAGDPNLRETRGLLKALARAGADIIELGVPFSDPVADGPVIQAASSRSLASGTTLHAILEMVSALRRGGFHTPVVLFSYLNPVLAMGVERFSRACRTSGVQGVLLVDLPVEEAGPILAALRRFRVEPVLLASPTTSEARLRRIGRESGSIVYYASREGVTGVRRGAAAGLAARLRRVRRLAAKPLIVGFGVSTPAQARALAPHAEGVVVGSALVAAAAAARPRARAAVLERAARRLVLGLYARTVPKG